MPLTTATDDEGFLEEISLEMREQSRRNHDHNTAMIEEYLRRRTQAVEAAAQERMEAREAEWQVTLSQAREGTEDLARKLGRARQQMDRAAAALAHANALIGARGCFSSWCDAARQRRANRGAAAALARRNEERAIGRAYIAWRLFTAARRGERQAAAAAREQNCHVEELTGQVEVFQEQLTAEKRRNAEMDEKLKAAFVRGISALNREAVQALRGAGADTDVAAIEDILSRDSASHRVRESFISGVAHGAGSEAAGGQQPQTRGVGAAGARPSDGPVSGICPVHHMDAERNFFHRCFAPSSCPYGPQCSGTADGYCSSSVCSNPDRRGSADTARVPFVVHGNLDSVPGHTAGARPKKVFSGKTTSSRMRF